MKYTMHLLIRLHIFSSLSTEPIYDVFIHVVITADLVKDWWCAAIGQTAFYCPPQLGAVRELSCKVDRTCSGEQDWAQYPYWLLLLEERYFTQLTAPR